MFDFLWSAGSFILAIGVLVAFHEFGHFWVARRLGVKVLRFSIGFGKPLWMRRARDGVEWAVSAIPLGGYVKMLDEREGPVAPEERDRAFNRQPPWKRILIVAAGPAFNFVLAISFYWAVLVIGVSDRRPLLEAPAAGTVAAAAGLVAGDEVLQLGDVVVSNWTTLRMGLVDQGLDRDSLLLRVRTATGAERRVELSLAKVRRDPEFLFADLGLEPFQPLIPPVLKEIVPGQAAAAAGFLPGDSLLAYEDTSPSGTMEHALASWQEWTTWLRAHPGVSTRVRVQRGAEQLTLDLAIGSDVVSGKAIGRFGAAVEVPAELWQHLRAEHRLDPLSAVPAAVKQTWDMSALTLKLLVRMVMGDVSVKNVSGPIQIAQFAGYSASIGLASFLGFLAIISVSLGVLNLLPVPVLDGGHLLYYTVEMVKGSPLSERAQALGQQIGITLLVGLMGLAFYNDIMRLIS
jgi:regulator of sigma E protease